MHTPSSNTLMLMGKLREKGNFVNFKKFTVDNDEQEILDGAMKVRSKEKQESLAIRARILRHNDFLSMTDHIQSYQMVNILKF